MADEQGCARLLRDHRGRRRGERGARTTSSATSTRTKSAAPSTAPACASWSSSPAACCAASTATTRTPGTSTRPPGDRRRAMQEIGKYAQGAEDQQGRPHALRRRAAGADGLRRRIFRRCKEIGPAHLPRHLRPSRRPADRRGADGHRPQPARHQVGRPGHLQEITNQPLQPTLDYARRLSAWPPMWVRFVLVPGLTDDTTTSRGSPTFCAG